jgi:hypothetical protein
VKLRCYILSFLRIHRPDCEHCKASETFGDGMRRRLEELNSWKQPNLLKKEVHGDAVEVSDSAPDEGVASPQISLVQRGKKAG